MAAQYAGRYQPAPVQPAVSVDRGTGLAFSSWGVPCLIPALRNVRLPKDFKGPRKVPNYTADQPPEAWVESYEMAMEMLDMDELEVSSSARRRNVPQGPNPTRGEVNAQDVVDNGRARREAALAAQYAGRYQPASVQQAASVDRGTGLAFSSWGCSVSFQLSVMCDCLRISRVHVRCPITLLISHLRHGGKVMRWQWRG